MRTQLTLSPWKAFAIAGISAALTLSLVSSDAVGYPAGAAVSLGANPIVSYGGAVITGATDTLFTAPSDSDVIVTDVFLSADNTSNSCKTMQAIHLRLDDGTELGRYTVGMDYWGGSGHQPVHASYTSGIRVPAGRSLEAWSQDRFSYSCAGIQVDYAISGYLAQP